MPRKGRRPSRNQFGKQIKAHLVIEPNSLKQFEKALLQLKEAVRAEIVDEALMAGAQIVKKAQTRRAPGPHIEIEFIKRPAALYKGSASGVIKRGLPKDARFVAIGPLKKHWYYLFREFGTKAHGVSKRKRTRKKQESAQYRALKITLTRKQKTARPMMSWNQNGRTIFAKMVRGLQKKAFVEPSVNENEAAINSAMAKVLAREIKKAIKGS